MKKLALLLLLCIGCGDTYYIDNYIYEDLEVDPYQLVEYNVILHEGEEAICGAVVIASKSSSCLILTAAHCTSWVGVKPYSVQPTDGNLYSVRVERREIETSDLALLECVDNLPIQIAAPVKESEPSLGETCFTTGFGAGVPDALSQGVVSKIYVRDHYDKIANQFDITAYYGNSGGGIFDAYGRVVGIMSQFGPAGAGKIAWMYGCTAKAINEIIDKYYNGR